MKVKPHGLHISCDPSKAFSIPSRNYCKLITVISFYSCFTLGKVLVTNLKLEEKRHGIDYQFNESNIMIAI